MSSAGETPAAESTLLNIEGLTEAIAIYDQLYGDLLELEPILREGAGEMADAAQFRIHSATYRLFGSITPLSTGAAAEVVSTSVYAAVQEWGWPAQHIPAQRYVQRAIIEEWPSVQRKAEGAIQDLVDALGAGE